MTIDCTQIRVGDINVQILINLIEDGLPIDLSSGSAQIKMKKPGGTVLTKMATFTTDGTNGSIYYNSIAGDFDEEGMWQLQAVATLGIGLYHSTIKNFEVHGNL